MAWWGDGRVSRGGRTGRRGMKRKHEPDCIQNVGETHAANTQRLQFSRKGAEQLQQGRLHSSAAAAHDSCSARFGCRDASNDRLIYIFVLPDVVPDVFPIFCFTSTKNCRWKIGDP